MKFSHELLRQVIREEMDEVLRIRDERIEERLRELRDQLGDEVFLKDLINNLSDDSLRHVFRKMAKEHGLTIGGVRHI